MTVPDTEVPGLTPPVMHLRAGGVSVVLDCTGGRLPRMVHWGADLGDLTSEQLAAVVAATNRQSVSGQMDTPLWLGVLPENAHGWMGTPGLAGHRDGQAFTTRFVVTAVGVLPRGFDTVASGHLLNRLEEKNGTQRVTVTATDPAAGLDLDLVIELDAAGLGRMGATLTNRADTPYTLDGLLLAWPVPAPATELLDFTGHHAHERFPQRHEFTFGTYVRDGRRGRTGSDATLLLLAGEPGFGWRRGAVWGVHTAWSGNHRTLAERTWGGESVLAGGELLLPGEVRLAPGERYESPWVYGSYGVGLDALSHRFHHFLRTRPGAPKHPRPVTGNCWEAVYFKQSLAPLIALADAFAAVGIERFVLDDGWFRGRRGDRAGLGDWYVDPDVWPHGLHPLIDHVQRLGMVFGLWVEPEMVNLDSDVARAHPDWILAPAGRLPLEQRHQHVLNLAHPAAFAYIRERLEALLTEYPGIAYLKWDHNRDLVEPGDQGGTPGVRAQTLAVYALIDALKAAHPGLEIESCSSGGSRADLAILGRTDRLWTSDCTDAHERQVIQRYTGLLVPPELMGAHISDTANHQTGRVLSMTMRAATAMFGDLGVEWNVAALDQVTRGDLAAWIATYKQWRGLLHSGDTVHVDHPDPALWVYGVVAPDRTQALFTAVLLATSAYSPTGMVRLVGLDPDATYHVEPLEITRQALAAYRCFTPPWWAGGLDLTGRVLMDHGFQLPELRPDEPLLLAVTQTSSINR